MSGNGKNTNSDIKRSALHSGYKLRQIAWETWATLQVSNHVHSSPGPKQGQTHAHGSSIALPASECLTYEEMGALLTSSPPSQLKVLTPPQHFSPLTNPVGCRVKDHRLGFPLSNWVLITRAKAVLTVTQACTHIDTWGNVTRWASRRVTAALGKCALGFELISEGSKFLGRERKTPLKFFHLCYFFQALFAPSKVYSLTRRQHQHFS